MEWDSIFNGYEFYTMPDVVLEYQITVTASFRHTCTKQLV